MFFFITSDCWCSGEAVFGGALKTCHGVREASMPAGK
jgi:hypothetical protein